MNKDRRKQIKTEETDASEIVSKVEDLVSNLEEIRDEEQEYLDNMPENMQDGEKGDIARAAVESLESVIDALQELVDADIVSALQEAQS